MHTSVCPSGYEMHSEQLTLVLIYSKYPKGVKSQKMLTKQLGVSRRAPEGQVLSFEALLVLTSLFLNIFY